jgi:polygalacturonase
MILNELLCTGRSATLEIRNGHAWESPHEYQLLLNGRDAGRTAQNVFTLHGLESDSDYRLEVQNGDEIAELAFRTAKESFRLDVRAFGAIGNGVTDDTASIQAALSSCPAGGVVEIPPGDWISAPLFLKSGVDLYLARGARLIGHPDIHRWPLLPGVLSETDHGLNTYLGSWEGHPQASHAALVNAIGIEDVRIHGEGCIDANASFDTWWSRPKQPFLGWRPRTIYCVHSRRIGMSGITLRNSPSWTIHALFCRDVNLAHLCIESPPRSPNTDGIVPESCENVRIAGARISTGDDCVAIKSGKAWIASRVSCPTRTVEVSNCLMERGHGAVVVGSEMAGGVYDVSIRNCLFRGTDRGLRIKTRRGRGPKAVVDGIRLHNVKMEHVGTPFVVNSFYFCDPDGREPHVGDRRPLPVDEGTPTLRNVTITNVDCRHVAHSAGFVLGLPERPLEGLTIRGYRVRFDADAAPGFPDRAESIAPVARDGLYLCNVRGVVLEDIDIEGTQGPRIRRENAG